MKSIVVVTDKQLSDLLAVGGQVADAFGTKVVGIDEIDSFGLAKYELICFGADVGGLGVNWKLVELIKNLSYNFDKKVAIFWVGQWWQKIFVIDLERRLRIKQVRFLGSWQFKNVLPDELSRFIRMIEIRK